MNDLKRLINKFRSVLFSVYRMEERLPEYPPGTLATLIQHDRSYYYWTRNENGRAVRSYVKLKDAEEMKARYQAKMQLLKAREEAEQWLIRVRKTLLIYGISPEVLEQECRNQYERQKMLFKTDRGEVTTCLSEQRIANVLYRYGIDYEYRAPLILKNRVYWPSYTIIHEKEVFYWEHPSRTLMPQQKKYEDYLRYGIWQGRNLIVTAGGHSSLEETDIVRILTAYRLIT